MPPLERQAMLAEISGTAGETRAAITAAPESATATNRNALTESYAVGCCRINADLTDSDSSECVTHQQVALASDRLTDESYAAENRGHKTHPLKAADP